MARGKCYCSDVALLKLRKLNGGLNGLNGLGGDTKETIAYSKISAQ